MRGGWSAALLEFRRSGDAARSRKPLRSALEQNPHVPAYLLGEKKLPRDLPDYIGFGDEPEAIAYAAEHGDAWRGTRGALDWLARAARAARWEPQAALAAALELGRRGQNTAKTPLDSAALNCVWLHSTLDRNLAR